MEDKYLVYECCNCQDNSVLIYEKYKVELCEAECIYCGSITVHKPIKANIF